MTTFFTPSGTNTSGFQRIGTDVSLITSTDRLLVGLSSTDLSSSERFVGKNSIYMVSATTDAILVGMSTVGGVASIVATSTGIATPPDLLFYVPAERMRLTHSSGQLAIGLTAPTAQIHVKEAADGYCAKFERNAGAIVGVNLTTTTAAIGTISSHTLTFTTNSVNAIFIDTSQKVGIGNTAPVTTLGVTGTVSCTGNLNIGSLAVGGAPLSVVGNNNTVFVQATTQNNVTFSTNSNDLHFSVVDAGSVTINTLTGDLKIGAGAINAFTIFAANGHAQVGDNTDRGFAFYVNGTSKYNGAITYTNTITATDLTKQISIGITKVGSTAAIDASAQLEVLSTTLGFLPPRMTTAQKNAISSPAAGLIVYDSTLGKLCVRGAAAWETITSA